LSRLYRTVGKDRVKTVLLDDLRDDPGREYRAVLAFLGGRDDGRSTFPVLNPGRTHRLPVLNYWIRQLSTLKRRCGIDKGFGLLGRLKVLNSRKGKRAGLSPDLQGELKAYFSEDIAQLARLLERDLNHWTGTP
jgi:hypothetical protein